VTIHTYERSIRSSSCEGLLREQGDTVYYNDIFLLPIPSSRDGVTVNGTDIALSDFIPLAKEGVLFVVYGLDRELSDRLTEKGAELLDLSLDEDFLCENGELTACATLGILLNSEKRVPQDMKIGIVGYGRIGKRLTRLLLYLGAEVCVYTSRNNTRLELCEFGVASQMSFADAELSCLDLLINTAPAKIFDTENKEKFPQSLRVIDLASGLNFPGVESVEKYPSVPAKMFPYSAGRIWYEAIERFITKKNKL